jgi:hypothetical protein
LILSQTGGEVTALADLQAGNRILTNKGKPSFLELALFGSGSRFGIESFSVFIIAMRWGFPVLPFRGCPLSYRDDQEKEEWDHRNNSPGQEDRQED